MRYILLILVGLLTLPAFAVVEVDVYSAEVVLDESNPDADKAAKSEGLEQVVIKASGKKNVASNPVIKKALSNANPYLAQISYGNIEGQRSLKVSFGSEQVNSLLTQANLPLWAAKRSRVLFWVVEESADGRAILWEQSSSDLISQIKSYANHRGLPITVPVGDMGDITSITVPELWGGFLQPISAVSQRYPVDAVLVALIQRGTNRSSVRWTLYDDKPQFLPSSNRAPVSAQYSGSVANIVEKMVDDVSVYYANKSSSRSSVSTSSSLKVKFVSVSNGSDFFKLESLLNQLHSVAKVEIDEIKGKSISFDISLIGSESEFENEVVQNMHVRKLVVDDLYMQSLPKNTFENQGDVSPITEGLLESEEQATRFESSSLENQVTEPMNGFNSEQESSFNLGWESQMNGVLTFEWVE